MTSRTGPRWACTAMHAHPFLPGGLPVIVRVVSGRSVWFFYADVSASS